MSGTSEQDPAISWPADADAVAYRVVRRGDSWRVQVRREGDERWQTYIPDVLVADAQLAAQPELRWPKQPSALAYRVMVRDEERDEVVLRQGFLGSPGRIDWSQLDASHPHRAQVQAWVEGEWRDHVPYRAISPPRERVGTDQVQLSWPDARGAHEYRVTMWSDDPATPLLDHKVADPWTWVPSSSLAPGRRWYWRVQVRRKPGASWTPHLPAVSWIDEELAAQPELSWPEAPGALAYRVVVRDVEADETVGKDAFAAAPGRIDWSGLDLSHPHRVAVEAWVDGSWTAHVASRVLFPPPERLLEGATEVKKARLRHVVVVRFPPSLLDAAYGVQRPAAIALERLRLFERLTLPSLKLLEGGGVMWFVVADPELSSEVMSLLRELCGERLLEGAERGPGIDSGPGGTALAWLTAGDGLHPGVPAAVERRAGLMVDADGGPTRRKPLSVEFPLCVEAGPDGARLARDRPAASFAVVVDGTDRPVDALDPRPPTLRLQSLDAQVPDWSVPALLRARPGPNEHPIFVRERGPVVEPRLLRSFGVDAATAGVSANGSAEPE